MGTDYRRTLVPIPGARTQAWLYHRRTESPANYQAQKRSRGRSASRDGNFRVDQRARLCIPVYWLRAAGLLPGNEAYVTSDDSSHSLILTRDRPDPSSTTILQTYKVEKDGNVRIAKTTFQKAGLIGRSYDIDGNTSRVMLRLHHPAKPN
jgi:hypothetical protein